MTRRFVVRAPRPQACAARTAVLIAAFLFALVAAPALAHDQPYSYIDLRLGPHAMEGIVMAHVADLAHEIGFASTDSLLRPETIARSAPALRAMVERRMDFIADGDTIHPIWTTVEAAPERHCVVLRWETRWRRVPGALHVRCRLFPYDPQHVTYLNIYEGGRLRLQELLDQRGAEIDYFSHGGQGRVAVIGAFLGAGTHHIFIGPDHVLFIVGLLLLGGGMGRLLKIVTAFTVAHSITLALASLGILNPSSRIVEPAIALSIAYVGAENLFAARSGRDVRALIAFGFGFVHGFGFASVLRDLGLPREALGWALFSFNGGVEVGQACIAGTFWFFQRVLLPS